jgi:Domain of unknown function (DUF4430)
MKRRAAIAAIAIASAVAVAGCGLGAGAGTGGAHLMVTSDFGGRQIAAVDAAHVPGSETVMRMLERRFDVKTRYGGGFVESINGDSGTSSQRDWFYYVNGVQAPQGAAATAVHHDDRIWFDLHDWRATDSIPAVVGSFPEPFANGIGGKRYPTTIECGSDVAAACKRVTAALSGNGVPVANQLIGTGSGPDTLGVVVGTWKQLAPELAAELIAHGPGASGVYAHFSGPAGSSLQLLDPGGHVVRTLTNGAGLVAATADMSSVPTWLVTGTDIAGVNAAARAFNEQALHDHFALAVQGDASYPVPLDGGQ